MLRVTGNGFPGEETAFVRSSAGRYFLHQRLKVPDGALPGAYRPNIFCSRYARERITEARFHAVPFWHRTLVPVNFDALFMNYLQQQAGEGGSKNIRCLMNQ
ncbi:hypothetical protein KCP78_18500 [Salmonella enterica subsp. enterica]|nr:hypothetical protein KCP78_18500 [Salmonella enterica subsp. enterica]